VKQIVGRDLPANGAVEIKTTASNDPRSYRVCTDKIRDRLGFVPKRTIEDAVGDLVGAFRAGSLPNAMTDSRYYNVKRMKEIQLR
jgi:hypothetical protein